ncbi:hypothetical protein C3477_28270 [Mycobacterium kansasii]|nr:hypothetical protein C3B43_17800 [Mycobacterium kansasii]POX92566.1 hypothetical protein C3477_28270 [Mycobacterium kansasii]POY22417.1 hypothetical protein C3476_11305 [Mycobacterium kansasii]
MDTAGGIVHCQPIALLLHRLGRSRLPDTLWVRKSAFSRAGTTKLVEFAPDTRDFCLEFA